MCKYSIIVPVYQVKDYIVQCLESIFCQIPTDVQVILVDDGSTDGSGEICDEYAMRYPQIEVIHQENKGVAAARNAGLDAANGEYLLWVDPDDRVSEDWFAEIDQSILNSKADILVFDYCEDTDGVCIEKNYARETGFVDKEVFLCDVARDIRIKSALWNKVIQRKLFAGLRFNEKHRCLEDYALLHFLIIRSSSILYIPKALYIYRLRNTGIVRTLNLDIAYQSYQIAIQRKKDIEKSGRHCEAIGSILQAKEFCRNYAIAGYPSEYKEEYQECKKAIRKNVFSVLCEKELPIDARIKCCLSSFAWLRKLYSVVKNGIHG